MYFMVIVDVQMLDLEGGLCFGLLPVFVVLVKSKAFVYIFLITFVNKLILTFP